MSGYILLETDIELCKEEQRSITWGYFLWQPVFLQDVLCLGKKMMPVNMLFST